METIRTYIHLFGGKQELLNIALLLLTSYFMCMTIRNRAVRVLISLLSSIFIVLQLISLYFVKSYIGYQFYVHFNTRDIFGMINIYYYQVFSFSLLLILLSIILYFSRSVLRKVYLLVIHRYLHAKNLVNHTRLNLIILTTVIISIVIMSFKGGIIDKSFEFISMLKSDNKDFRKALQDVGMEDYVLPDELKVVGGKNIIIISLESLERGYMSNKLAHLTPNLRALRNDWNYYDMQQNLGSDWTSGSLYTCLSGLPAFFGVHGNSIFQTAYHSNITGISHVLNKGGYNISYLSSDARFSGTQEMLNTFQISNIIDGAVVGKELRDKDLFEKAKLKIQSNLSQKKQFALFISTIDTHFPDGIYDKRMQEYVPQQKTNLEFMVSAVDYMLKDFVDYLKRENILSNTVVYIFPDHLMMGDASIFNGTGERSLYCITNAHLNIGKTDTLYQIDLPKIILYGANIKHNAKFLTDYIPTNKGKYIRDNINMLTTLNTSGLLRFDAEPYQAPQLSKNYKLYLKDSKRYIAHAGGMIDDKTYTNSLEALSLNYDKGFRLFELDIVETSDGKFVAAHDWKHWANITKFKGKIPVTNEEFLKHKIYGKYTPLDLNKINEWFKEHKDAILITDKINKPKEFSGVFVDKNRLMMELFSLEAVKEGVKAKIKSSIPSQNVLEALEGDKVEVLKQLGINHIALSRSDIGKHRELLIRLKKNDIKAYVYHINFEIGKDEEYVVKYEMDYIYGIYADKWNFEQK